MVILENYFSSVLLSFPSSWADSYCLMLRETLARAPSPQYCGLTRNRGRTQGLTVEYDCSWWPQPESRVGEMKGEGELRQP